MIVRKGAYHGMDDPASVESASRTCVVELLCEACGCPLPTAGHAEEQICDPGGYDEYFQCSHRCTAKTKKRWKTSQTKGWLRYAMLHLPCPNASARPPRASDKGGGPPPPRGHASPKNSKEDSMVQLHVFFLASAGLWYSGGLSSQTGEVASRLLPPSFGGGGQQTTNPSSSGPRLFR